jgi:hypothetical protein
MARKDGRFVAGALVGGSAVGGDRWSDLDLTFGLSEGTAVGDILEEWTKRLDQEFQAVPLFDLPYQSTVYRVFLFPGCLQVDLSFGPGRDFGSLGPRFSLLFGQIVNRSPPQQSTLEHLFGLAVHHLVRARICIERGRFWQAEYWISSARDQGMTLACRHYDLESSYGRGFDQLPTEVLAKFSETLVSTLDRNGLLKALKRTVECLLHNSQDIQALVGKVEGQLRELCNVQPKYP